MEEKLQNYSQGICCSIAGIAETCVCCEHRSTAFSQRPVEALRLLEMWRFPFVPLTAMFNKCPPRDTHIPFFYVICSFERELSSSNILPRFQKHVETFFANEMIRMEEAGIHSFQIEKFFNKSFFELKCYAGYVVNVYSLLSEIRFGLRRCWPKTHARSRLTSLRESEAPARRKKYCQIYAFKIS